MVVIRRTAINMLRKKLKLDHIDGAQNSTDAPQSSDSLASQLLELELQLNETLKRLVFKPPVAYVYHPLDYAYKPHSVFTQKYCNSPKKILFLGMNPGPWGMCQTGVPFGEVKIVKEWFQIDEEVSKPEKECSERKVLGLACTRSEVSGQRIWGLFRNLCRTPENFFASAYMYNYCPIAMLKNNGANVTPTEIKGEAQQQLEEICDAALAKVIKLLQVETVVGVGKFAETRVKEVLKKENLADVKVFYLLHPSPRVANNQNWPDTAQKRLSELNLLQYFNR